MDEEMLIKLNEAIDLVREEMLNLPEGSEERARAARTYKDLLEAKNASIKLDFDMEQAVIQKDLDREATRKEKARDRKFQKKQAEIDRQARKKVRWVELAVGAATTIVVAVGGVLLDKFGLEPFSKIWHQMLSDSTRQKK